MPNPKRRHSNSRTRKRRTHYKVIQAGSSVCPQCGGKKLPHRVCQVCGHYRGQAVVQTDED